jgi:RNA polymerase sigma factor (sigma-70 family)
VSYNLERVSKGSHLDTNPQVLAQNAVSDPQSFSALYDQYFPRVYNYFRFRCNDRETADELVSQVFERLFIQLPRYRADRGSFDAWLFTMARNILTDHFRAKKMDNISWDSLTHEPYNDSPESQVIIQETRAELLSAIEKLDGRSRDLIGLKFGAQLTNRQIAELSHLSESNVAVILYRAMTRLREFLQMNYRVSQPDRSLP